MEAILLGKWKVTDLILKGDQNKRNDVARKASYGCIVTCIITVEVLF